MEKFEVHILGCGSALPTTRHFSSSQVINLREKLFMIDCGEGAQLQLRKSHLKFSRLGHIFISHLHGDHVFGLMGMISTFGLLGRTAELHIFSPVGLQKLFAPHLDFFCSKLPFNLVFHEFESNQSSLIFEDRTVEVYTIPLRHRLPCCGFLFKEKKLPNHLIRSVADFYGVPMSQYNIIKNGADFVTSEGEVVPNSALTIPSYTPRSYAYCSDTCFKPDIVSLIDGVNVLFHEATFQDVDEPRAKETYHSTATQAATIAKEAHAGQLVIGHFSARYDDENVLLAEAQKTFPDAQLAFEGLCIDINSDE